jgi:Domain of unknown function (DUF4037)
MPEFTPGLQLCRLYYQEAVWPVLAEAFPGLAYAAALLGPGSEVLGYDTPLSPDHCWGPRLFLFLDQPTYERLGTQIAGTLAARLPQTFRGWPTDAGPPGQEGIRLHALRPYFHDHLGFDPLGETRPADWLTVPEQALLELTAGEVYHDGLGDLTAARARLAYYPHDVWLYLMAAQWRRIGQQEAFVGRTGDLGDELGSRLIAATIVHDLMRLCFLIERRYAPYSKWFGTAFARLTCGSMLGPLFSGILQADGWQARQARLAEAYAAVVTLHNALGVTPAMTTAVSRFHDRPFLVIHADQIADALSNAIADPDVRRMPACGGINQLSDNTDLLDNAENWGKLRALYE